MGPIKAAGRWECLGAGENRVGRTSCDAGREGLPSWGVARPLVTVVVLDGREGCGPTDQGGLGIGGHAVTGRGRARLVGEAGSPVTMAWRAAGGRPEGRP